jgi:hypothetical protein
MANMNVPFGGSTLIVPGAYANDSVAAALPTTPPATPPLIFLGYGYCQPFTPVTYQSAATLQAALRGGPATDYINFIYNPSTQLQGAQQVTFIECGTNTQSAAALNASGSVQVILLRSGNYGLPSNLLQRQVQSGTSAGAKITLYDGYSQATVVGDNLGVPFTLSYLGAATGVTYSVIVTGGAATALTTNSTASGESLNIPLGAGQFSTVSQVVQYLNGTSAWSAQVLSTTNGALPSSSLDAAANIPMASGGGTSGVTAILGDPVYWVNNLTGGLATASIVSGITSSVSAALVPTVMSPFSGATSTPPTLANYASGFNVALTVQGWAVFADSNASGVVALGVQHVQTAGTPAQGKWRRFFTGSSIGDSVAQAVSRSQQMNSIYGENVYPGIWRTSTTTGLNVLYDGLHAAAAAAGMSTGNPPATPLTNKALLGNGVEVNLTVDQINTLQQAGVMPIWISPQTGVPTIVSDFTTWQVDANPENVFAQQVACRNFLEYGMVTTMQPYVGSIAAPTNETVITNAAISYLNNSVWSPNRSNGVLAAWDSSSLQLIFTGAQQLAAIAVNVIYVGQNRFITTTFNVQPLNIVVVGSTPAATIL